MQLLFPSPSRGPTVTGCHHYSHLPKTGPSTIKQWMYVDYTVYRWYNKNIIAWGVRCSKSVTFVSPFNKTTNGQVVVFRKLKSNTEANRTTHLTNNTNPWRQYNWLTKPTNFNLIKVPNKRIRKLVTQLHDYILFQEKWLLHYNTLASA